MTFWGLIVVLSAVALLHYVLVGRSEGILTLDSLFVVTQWIISVGTLWILDPANRADRTYAIVMTAPLIVYVAISVVTYWVLTTNGPRATQRPVVYPYRPSLRTWALLFLSAGITIAYFSAVGYNVLALGVRGLFFQASTDYTSLRLGSYSAERYFYPGYVNQFKNAILPALTVVVCHHLFATRSPWRWALSAPLILLAVFSILGTGQRGAFVQFALTLIVYLFLLDRGRFLRRAVLTSVVVMPPLLFVTLLLGRSARDLESQDSIMGKVSIILGELFKRVFHDSQWSGQMAFRFTFGEPTQNGAEWVSAILGILPGHPGSPLAHQVFNSMFGTDRGTAPPSMWGSVYYNFGWFGLVLVPIVLAIVYQIVTFRATHQPRIGTVELIGMSGTFVIFGNWVAGGPEYLLNAGGVTFALLWWLGRSSRRRREAALLIGGPGSQRKISSRTDVGSLPRYNSSRHEREVRA